MAARHKPKTLVFDEVLGMPVITVQTSQGEVALCLRYRLQHLHDEREDSKKAEP
jgi:hypothetical protein